MHGAHITVINWTRISSSLRSGALIEHTRNWSVKLLVWLSNNAAAMEKNDREDRDDKKFVGAGKMVVEVVSRWPGIQTWEEEASP
ncbi:hypothetical protein TIFTF001_039075 [Ficus carica]|uniref:Uncharacterized protein n=1 Tax=Ficus carica TaxID=3494 RepID=A0AA88EBQ1_FICCA|nr:hypothetical protein TIFTF001_039075 [Ficus carica]